MHCYSLAAPPHGCGKGSLPCAWVPYTFRKYWAPEGYWFESLAAYLQQLLTAAASALGVTDAQLKADLAKGTTLSQVAAAHTPAITEAQFRSRLIANLTPLLDTAGKEGKLMSTQEQAILSDCRLDRSRLELLNVAQAGRDAQPRDDLGQKRA